MPPHRWCLEAFNAPGPWESSRGSIAGTALTCANGTEVLRSC
ncbi:hypothetical protein YT1_2597 [Rhodococcus ruber]|nr:hypothetical protein YT1_2597 [Rhodococcus ruber]